MSALRSIHHKKLERVLKRIGCKFVRQTGSHKIYKRADVARAIVVPRYESIPIFVIRNIVNQLNLSIEEYLRLLDEV